IVGFSIVITFTKLIAGDRWCSLVSARAPRRQPDCKLISRLTLDLEAEVAQVVVVHSRAMRRVDPSAIMPVPGHKSSRQRPSYEGKVDRCIASVAGSPILRIRSRHPTFELDRVQFRFLGQHPDNTIE